MRKVVLTGINGKVAQVMKNELEDRYEVEGLSLVRMDDVLAESQPASWQEQLGAFNDRLMQQLEQALQGAYAVAHLGWNTRDENCSRGLDPLNIMAVDCVYRAAVAAGTPRIYMASSVHSYDFMPVFHQDVEPIRPFPDTRTDPFGVPPTSLYGVSKRWMEIAGQFYAQQLSPEQKVLVVRLGGVGRSARPRRRGSRLWNSHRDVVGLFEAFMNCPDAPNFWIAFSVSNNHGDAYSRPLFDAVNPYGFEPQDNSFALLDMEEPEQQADQRKIA